MGAPVARKSRGVDPGPTSLRLTGDFIRFRNTRFRNTASIVSAESP